MTDPTTRHVPVSEVHDGPDEGPLETELPVEGAPVVLTRPVRAQTSDGLVELTLPAGTRCTYQGHIDDHDHEVSAALIVKAVVRLPEFREVDR